MRIYYITTTGPQMCIRDSLGAGAVNMHPDGHGDGLPGGDTKPLCQLLRQDGVLMAGNARCPQVTGIPSPFQAGAERGKGQMCIRDSQNPLPLKETLENP